MDERTCGNLSPDAATVPPRRWFVLYVRAGKETRVMDDLTQAFSKLGSDAAFEPFCPMTEVFFRAGAKGNAGKSYRKRPLFSGYVFIETTLSSREFLDGFSQLLWSSTDVVRLLRYSNERIALSPHEQARFEYLFRGTRCITRSVGCIEGDRIIITAGPLVGREAMIRKINRHNRTATVSLPLFDKQTPVTLPLEIVSKTKE